MKKKLPDLAQLTADEGVVMDTLNGESDLSATLIGASYLDLCLTSILERAMIESGVRQKLLTPDSGALGSLQAKSDLAYCVGLIAKDLYQDLVLVAQIRNKFAHSHLETTFDHVDIVSLCADLSWAQKLREEPGYKPSGPKTAFVFSVVIAAERFRMAAHLVERPSGGEESSETSPEE